jgi:hypothetical protein
MTTEWNRDACDQWTEDDGPDGAYDEWCEWQDAMNDAPYLPTPEEMGRCYSGLHDCDAGCCCSEHYIGEES